MPKKALLIAFHFPPFGFSSGLLRTLKNVQHLPSFGWDPIVISADRKAYVSASDDQLSDIPPSVPVTRAFCLDAARHFSIGGRYPRFLAMPDRWVSWWPAAVFHGVRLVRRHRVQAIWSTYPIATAHLIGLAIHKLTGVPWVADMRDIMSDDGFPSDPRQWRCHQWIERRCIQNSAATICTTEGTARVYRSRYDSVDPSKISVIHNGYDEDDFVAAERDWKPEVTVARKPLVFVHSGVLYPSERDPLQFFEAVRRLKSAGAIRSETLKVVLRATQHDSLYQPVLEEMRIDDIVHLSPKLPYKEALREMMSADGLLVFQASNCNMQIPAKIYEYFRSGRPILALTDDLGDTAAILREVGVDSISVLDDPGRIAVDLREFMQRVLDSTIPGVGMEVASRYSRRAQAGELAGLFEQVAR
jgi:glycosyltransferase involved in cell wall biosynthesis